MYPRWSLDLQLEHIQIHLHRAERGSVRGVVMTQSCSRLNKTTVAGTEALYVVLAFPPPPPPPPAFPATSGVGVELANKATKSYLVTVNY